jgi:hypothetical protein
MDEIYFINEKHKVNFKKTLVRWNVARIDPEYMTACYIMSIPMIFDKVGQQIGEYEQPTDWILKYFDWREEYQEEWRNDDEDQSSPEYEAWLERQPFDLTNSMIQLGRLALNLWNGYSEFNLLDCMNSLDDKHYLALICAINIRRGKIR